jgi:DNA-binding transcriptional MerR regulator
MDNPLPPIPAKRYFTIGEVSDLCQVKPYVLRYWEQEFSQLRPMKRRGNRRYYQMHEVQLIRRIRGLLYDEGFTIAGARNRLADLGAALAPGEADDSAIDWDNELVGDEREAMATAALASSRAAHSVSVALPPSLPHPDGPLDTEWLRNELQVIRRLLDV